MKRFSTTAIGGGGGGVRADEREEGDPVGEALGARDFFLFSNRELKQLRF